MEEQQQQPRKSPFPFDWDYLLDGKPAGELVVKPSAMASDQERQSFVPGLEDLKDYELEDNIRRKKMILDTAGRNLPDRGVKLGAIIKSYEDEVHRRKLNPLPKFSAVQQKVGEEQMKMPEQATLSSSVVGDDAKPNKERVVLETKHNPATNPLHKASSDTVQPKSIPAELVDLRTHIDECFRT